MRCSWCKAHKWGLACAKKCAGDLEMQWYALVNTAIAYFVWGKWATQSLGIWQNIRIVSPMLNGTLKRHSNFSVLNCALSTNLCVSHGKLAKFELYYVVDKWHSSTPVLSVDEMNWHLEKWLPRVTEVDLVVLLYTAKMERSWSSWKTMQCFVFISVRVCVWEREREGTSAVCDIRSSRKGRNCRYNLTVMPLMSHLALDHAELFV